MTGRIAGAGLVGAALVGAAWLVTSGAPSTLAPPRVAPPPVARVAPAPSPAPLTEAPARPEPLALPVAEPLPSASGPSTVAARSGTRRPGKHTAASAPSPSPVPVALASTTAAAAPDELRTADGRSLDDLLDSATGGKRPGKKDEDSPELDKGPDLPDLTRQEIVAAMKVLRPRMKDCYRQHQVRGIAFVRVSIGSEGEVASAAVKGPLAATPTGACVETAVRAASFPASRGMTFQYPFPVR